MARSAKQLAFFKRIVDEAGLCGPGPGAGPQDKDIFDYHGRLKRATKSAIKAREIIRKYRSAKFSNAWARKHGFPDYAAMLAANWEPFKTQAAYRKRVKASQRVTKPTKTISGYKKKQENPFQRNERIEYRG